jgi:hypothetical protein
MTHFAPPAVKAAERILLDIEVAVRRWPRVHRYAVGAELRKQALALAVGANLAWREQSRRGEHVRAMVQGVEALKVLLQLGSQLKAFNSFGQFEQIARQAHDLGRQVGGWSKSEQHPKTQNCGRQDGAPRARSGTEYPRRPIGANR